MRKLTLFLLLGLGISITFLSGCDVVAGPMGCPGAGMEYGHTPTDGTIANPHCLPAFGSRLLDGCGILVGADGMVIDPDHVHGWARITIGMYKKIYSGILEKETEFTSDFIKFHFIYPQDWDKITEEQKKQIALQIAESAAFNDGVWHEIASWYGYSTLLFPDFESAFSYEDLYCNFLGVKIAIEAIQLEGNVTRNVTTVRDSKFKKFKLVSREKGLEIIRLGKGTHWDDKPHPFAIAKPVIWRNMDIGTSDGLVNPTVIPVNANSKIIRNTLALPVPQLNLLEEYGLQMKLTISSWAPKHGTVKNLLGINRPVEPLRDYPDIIEIIKKEAEKKGFTVDY